MDTFKILCISTRRSVEVTSILSCCCISGHINHDGKIFRIPRSQLIIHWQVGQKRSLSSMSNFFWLIVPRQFTTYTMKNCKKNLHKCPVFHSVFVILGSPATCLRRRLTDPGPAYRSRAAWQKWGMQDKMSESATVRRNILSMVYWLYKVCCFSFGAEGFFLGGKFGFGKKQFCEILGRW